MNLDALNNISDFVLNESLINNSQEVVKNIAYNADPVTGGWFGFIVLLVLFVFTLYGLYKDDFIFRLDFVQAGLYSSFFVVSVGVILLVAGIISDFRHLMWFAVAFLIFLIARWMSKQQ